MNKIAFPNHTIIIIKRKDDHNDIKGKRTHSDLGSSDTGKKLH